MERRSLSLRELRQAAGLTQADMAHATFTTQSSVSRFENEEDVRVSTLARYVSATGGQLRLVVERHGELVDLELPVLDPRPSRTFRVVWQDPSSRSMVDVGRLHDDGHSFQFAYTAEARSHPSFEPFPGLEELDQRHGSEVLFPFFADRAVRAAGSNHDLAAALGLAPHQAEPVELLVRAWGQTPHDSAVQVIPEPTEEADGSRTLLFLASGVRHVVAEQPGEREEALATLQPGDRLELRPEPDNPVDPDAVLLVAQDTPVAYVPRYLTQMVLGHRKVEVKAEHVNGPATASHLRLLCRLRIEPGPQPEDRDA